MYDQPVDDAKKNLSPILNYTMTTLSHNSINAFRSASVISHSIFSFRPWIVTLLPDLPRGSINYYFISPAMKIFRNKKGD
jgi:hypothetical protein